MLASGINVSSPGWAQYDSGWVDLSDSDLDAFLTLGRMQVSGPSGAVLSSGSMQIFYR